MSHCLDQLTSSDLNNFVIASDVIGNVVVRLISKLQAFIASEFAGWGDQDFLREIEAVLAIVFIMKCLEITLNIIFETL